MHTQYHQSIFLFRRDLRLRDNTGLFKALSESTSVIPIFIFDTAQSSATTNAYFSENAFEFMIQSLRDLDKALRNIGSRLYIFEGSSSDIIQSLISSESIDAVYVNKDFTPFARKRDFSIQKICARHEIPFERIDDYTLSPIETIRTGANTLYTVFTPFMRQARLQTVPHTYDDAPKNYASKKLALSEVSLKAYDTHHNPHLFCQGGRQHGLAALEQLSSLTHYDHTRNFPAFQGTSRLSPHLKFGTLSIREVYEKTQSTPALSEQFITELYWRDFYLYIAYHFPHVFGQSFLPWGDMIAWENNESHFNAWKTGQTGVPIVDAAMRELNTTGWMHNRARMIVASYLTKNLLIDWRWGEAYFASKLIDYDPSSNNGGWQWSASVGADPKPIRIFNPYLQTSKYDPDATYIQTWVPELQNIPAAKFTDGKVYDFSIMAPTYPAPVIEYKTSYQRARAAYKQAKQLFREMQL